jgi:hypothetical protein
LSSRSEAKGPAVVLAVAVAVVLAVAVSLCLSFRSEAKESASVVAVVFGLAVGWLVPPLVLAVILSACDFIGRLRLGEKRFVILLGEKKLG